MRRKKSVIIVKPKEGILVIYTSKLVIENTLHLLLGEWIITQLNRVKLRKRAIFLYHMWLIGGVFLPQVANNKCKIVNHEW